MTNPGEPFPPPGSRDFAFGRPRPVADFMRGDPLLEADLTTRIGSIYSPRFDLVETPDKYTLLGDLPGLGLRDLDIDLTAGTLTITGEREPEPLAPTTSSHALERTFGSFFRSFHLPGPGLGGCSARMRNGVLTVEVPKLAVGPPQPGAPWH